MVSCGWLTQLVRGTISVKTPGMVLCFACMLWPVCWGSSTASTPHSVHTYERFHGQVFVDAVTVGHFSIMNNIVLIRDSQADSKFRWLTVAEVPRDCHTCIFAHCYFCPRHMTPATRRRGVRDLWSKLALRWSNQHIR